MTLTKLKEGQEYEFRVMAENANGLSEPLVTDRSVLVKNPFGRSRRSSRTLQCCRLDAPGQTGTPECKSRDRDRIEIKWAAPRNDGGNPIKGYVVERREKGAKKRDWTTLARGDLQKASECQFSFLLMGSPR